jgi:hypothetical protein
VRVLVFQDRLINGSIDSPLEPQPAPSSDHTQLIRVRIQTRWRATATTTAKAKTLIRKTIDTSDLLIQTRFSSAEPVTTLHGRLVFTTEFPSRHRTALHLYVPGQASPPSDNAFFMLRIFGFLISAIYSVVKGGLSCAPVSGVGPGIIIGIPTGS